MFFYKLEFRNRNLRKKLLESYFRKIKYKIKKFRIRIKIDNIKINKKFI